MSLIATIAEKLGIAGDWTERGHGVRFPCGPWNLRLIASLMNDCQARFITITAIELPGSQGFCLEYLWDFEGRVLVFPVSLTGKSIESIYDICEAADWIEREVHEGFGIEFTGREYKPLLLRAGDRPGVNLREEAS